MRLNLLERVASHAPLNLRPKSGRKVLDGLPERGGESATGRAQIKLPARQRGLRNEIGPRSRISLRAEEARRTESSIPDEGSGNKEGFDPTENTGPARNGNLSL